MKNLAALYTCFNRKEKTLEALSSLYQAKKKYTDSKLQITVYLTDDGSTDGTSEAVKKKFPKTIIIQGNGSLYWAEGMRKSWNAALNKKHDGYLLLNDDTMVYPNFLLELIQAHSYSLSKYGKPGIYLGATQDETTGGLTYSGSIITNKFSYAQKRLAPNGSFQKCDIGNANIMLVPAEVVDELGILTSGYAHGKADYDYTLQASRKKIPVLIGPEYLGECKNDHRNYYDEFTNKSITERRNTVYRPTELDFASHYKFVKKFFPWRAPFVWFFSRLKIYFPNLYFKITKVRMK